MTSLEALLWCEQNCVEVYFLPDRRATVICKHKIFRGTTFLDAVIAAKRDSETK